MYHFDRMLGPCKVPAILVGREDPYLVQPDIPATKGYLGVADFVSDFRDLSFFFFFFEIL